MKIRFLAVVVLAAIAAMPVSAQEFGRAGKIITASGAPVNGTNEIQTVTFGAGITSGTFKLKTPNGEITGAITWSSTNATLIANVDAALEALPSIGSGGVVTADSTLSSGIGNLTVTFSGSNVAKHPIGAMTVPSQPTGGTITVTASTPGVSPTGGAATERGCILVRTDTGDGYINQGLAPNISWVKFTP